MSRWTHAICAVCYQEQEPGRTPTTLIEAGPETCCFCGRTTQEGIYYRHDPAPLRCHGAHEVSQPQGTP